MPRGYFLAEVDGTKPNEYEAYRTRVLPAVEKYGGRFLVRGGSPTGIEGTDFARRVIIIEFDSPEQAKAWYDSRISGHRADPAGQCYHACHDSGRRLTLSACPSA